MGRGQASLTRQRTSTVPLVQSFRGRCRTLKAKANWPRPRPNTIKANVKAKATVPWPRPSHNANNYNKIRSNEILLFSSTLAKSRLPTVSKESWNIIHSSRWKLIVNFVVCQGFGLEFLAKAKPLRPRPRPQSKGQARPRPAYCKAKATKFGLKAKD